jgi:hypothetical protein
VPLGTPYVTGTLLTSAPTGVSWQIVPRPRASEAEVAAEINNIAWRSTSILDTFCNQVLRSTVASEQLAGPGYPRCNIDRNTGNGVLQASWWPVTEVLAVQVSPARAFPPVWTPVPAGQYRIRHPVMTVGDTASATAPDGSWTVDVAPGYIGGSPWGTTPSGGFTGAGGGRGSQLVQLCHLNGWPHTSLTGDAVAAATVLNVDDVTGWAGASGFAYDGAATEPVTVASVSAVTPIVLPNGAGTAQSGPGTVTLTSPLAFAHQQGTMISALPAAAIQAAILAAAVQALTGGTDAITIQSVGGEHSSPQPTAEGMTKAYQGLLAHFRRVM